MEYSIKRYKELGESKSDVLLILGINGNQMEVRFSRGKTGTFFRVNGDWYWQTYDNKPRTLRELEALAARLAKAGTFRVPK